MNISESNTIFNHLFFYSLFYTTQFAFFARYYARLHLMNNNVKYFVEFYIGLIFLSTSGVLGRYISLAPPLIIWARCVLAAIALFLFIRWRGIPYQLLSTKHRKPIIISSLLLGAHWITYFYALHLSNVAIGMLSLFTYPVLTTLIEPIFLKTKFLLSNLFLAVLVIIGMYFLVPEFNVENNYFLGASIGILSAFLYSFRNLILKKHIVQYAGTTLMFYQLAVNALVLLPVLFLFDAGALLPQMPWILILALMTTAIGHTLFVMSFKKFSISAASIMSSLQPLMGIVWAIVFLNEIPGTKTMIGGALILITVIFESVRSIKS